MALTSSSAVAFNVSKRKSQDLGFGALYLLLLLATLGFAAYGASKADLDNLRGACRPPSRAARAASPAVSRGASGTPSAVWPFCAPSPPVIGASPPSPPTVDFSGDLKIIAESWYTL